MAVDTKKFVEQLAQNCDLGDEMRAALVKAADNPKFAKELGDAVMRQEDYSRSKDELAKAQQGLDATKTEWTDWYKTAQQRDQEREAELVELREKAKGAGAGGNGNGGSGGGNGNGTPAGLTQKELEAALAKERAFGVSVSKTVGRITARHLHEFNEEPDFEAIEKIAMTDNVTAEAAYDKWVKPRRDEKSKLEREEELKKAREEGAREALSKHNLPGETQARGHHTFFDRDKAAATAPKSERDRADSFAKAYSTPVK